MRDFIILAVIGLMFAGCASQTREMPKESALHSADVEKRKNIITVVLIVETTLEELGSFEATLTVNSENLRFSEFIPSANLPYEIKHDYDEDKGKLKILGYNSSQAGKRGRFKIAHVYFENLVMDKPVAFQKRNIMLSAGDAYSPLPEQKKINPSFSLSLYEGYITK